MDTEVSWIVVVMTDASHCLPTVLFPFSPLYFVSPIQPTLITCCWQGSLHRDNTIILLNNGYTIVEEYREIYSRVEITAHGRFEGLDPWDFFLWPQPTI
jgi:hypothetical protein